MKCSSCSKVMPNNIPYCPYCGERLRQQPKRIQPAWLQPKSLKGFFLVVLVLCALMLMYLTFTLGESNIYDSSKLVPTSTANFTPTIIQTPMVIQTVPSTSTITPAPDQKTFTNSIGMDFVLIPAGEFDMGSPTNKVGEGPVHHVNISKAFYMGKYEVMQKQWRNIMDSSPSKFIGDNLPVESVSWNDVQDFIKKLNEKEGANKYRLPTEAEWEYSARAGTTTRYSFGDDESKLGDYAWYDENSGSKTHDVGQKKPNPWGLYDMHGNVFEWVQDRWHRDYSGAPIDGSSWESGDDSWRVIRGSYWYSSVVQSITNRYLDGSTSGNDIRGFRVVKDL